MAFHIQFAISVHVFLIRLCLFEIISGLALIWLICLENRRLQIVWHVSSLLSARDVSLWNIKVKIGPWDVFPIHHYSLASVFAIILSTLVCCLLFHCILVYTEVYYIILCHRYLKGHTLVCLPGCYISIFHLYSVAMVLFYIVSPWYCFISCVSQQYSILKPHAKVWKYVMIVRVSQVMRA